MNKNNTCNCECHIQHQKCNCHMGIFWRNSLYDAAYCPDCRVWLESKCSDPDCEYCSERPDTPPRLKEDNSGTYYEFEDSKRVYVDGEC